MPKIHTTTKLVTIGSWTILKLPQEASAKLPSRGQVMVNGMVNGHAFRSPLEPDGNWSHWFRVDDNLGKAAGIAAGDTVTLEIEPTKDWPEPDVLVWWTWQPPSAPGARCAWPTSTAPTCWPTRFTMTRAS